jgi:hypothetical protein
MSIQLKNHKTPVFPILEESIPNLPYKGRYRTLSNASLNGIYQRNCGKFNERLFIGNGHCHHTYRYPIILKTFHSPLINDYNLNFCNGWFMPRSKNREDLDTEFLFRVIDRKKPIAFISGDKHKIDRMQGMAEEFDCLTSISQRSTYWEIGVSRPETFRQLFDLDALKSDYQKYAQKLEITNPEWKTFYSKIQDKTLADFLTFDYMGSKKNSDVIITGLILGYPIYSTASVMWTY